MADFVDITGWRDEIFAFNNSKEGAIYRNKWKQIPREQTKLPYETVLHLAELIFRHEEIYMALKKRAAWISLELDAPGALIEDTDPYGPLKPYKASNTLGDFLDWYAMKTRCPHNIRALFAAIHIAVDVQNGRFSSPRSPEVKIHYQTQLPTLIYDIEF